MIKNIVRLALLCFAIFLCACSNPAPGPATANSNAGSAKQPAAAPVALPISAYSVQWISQQLPTEMKLGEERKVTVTLRNTGDAAWPSKGTSGTNINQVSISYHWLPPTGDAPIILDGARSLLSHDIAPGETYTANNVSIFAPTVPGSYRLQLTLVHEAVTWFEWQGAKTVIVPVTVS